MLYVRDLELELSTLLNIGCIEPCVSPYSSALVLVRKTGGWPQRLCGLSWS